MNTLEILQDLLIKQYAVTREQVGPDAELASIGVDSLGLIELMFQVEDQFGITLPDDKPPVLTRISDVVTFIEQMAKPQSAVPHAGTPPKTPGP
jgi:acyl carrier protein